MFKHWKFKKGQEIFLIGDSHFCHNKEFLYGKRNYKSIEEHDESLIKIWNERVHEDGIVIHLGDFMLNGSVEKCKDYIWKLNGQIIYLWGNHSNFIKELYKEALQDKNYPLDIEVYPLTWKNKLTFVGESFSFYYGKRFIVSSHFPYVVWDYAKHGSCHASAHQHSGNPNRNPDYPYDKAVDCGVENFGGPIHIEKFLEICDKKQYRPLDDHH